MPKIEIVKKVINDSHYYYVDNQFYPSVTTVLHNAAPMGDSLRAYLQRNTSEDIERALKESSERGTKVHNAAEFLARGGKLSLKEFTNEEQRFIASFYTWFTEAEPTNYRTEVEIASKSFSIAGTTDFVGEFSINALDRVITGGKGYLSKTTGKEVQSDRVKCLVDYKTTAGIYPSHELQLAAYKHIYEEFTGEHIDAIFILRLGTKHKSGYEFKQITNTTFEDFLNVYKTYLWLNGGKIPEPPTMNQYPETLTIPDEMVRPDNDTI